MDFFDQDLPSDTPSKKSPPAARTHAAHAATPRAAQPLAERMRPRSFDEWIGQKSVAGEHAPLRRMLRQQMLPSLIFWGPPGCGKTTLAHLIAQETGLAFQALSAVTSGIKEVKEVIDQAAGRLALKGRKTLLFIDEIHRFNKAQQDAFLPHVENGTVVLIGATTENPSFSVIAPLLSRARVLTLSPLSLEEIKTVLRRALEAPERGLGQEGWTWEEAALERLAQLSDGDARRALNLLEQAAAMARSLKQEGEPPRLTVEDLSKILDRDHLLYDRSGEEHYNLISALHKSMRASEPQAALYWLTRMLAAGEDPLYIARRVIRFASEDVGLADPQALPLAIAAMQNFQILGTPEGELGLAEAVVYMATAPKSNSLYSALDAAREAVKTHGALPVPVHLRNAPTRLMKSLGYGREYVYDHDAPDHFSGQPCLPEALEGTQFYEPGQFGFEKEIQKRLEWWEKKRQERREESK
jgi:putative ATPase